MNQGPCKNACKECPFKKTSAPGWLGAASFEEDPGTTFLTPHWTFEMPLPCHMQVNWSADDSQSQAQQKPLCFGFLTMMKNAGKLPRSPELSAHVSGMQKDDSFFTLPHEFVDYHNKGFAT